MIMIMMMTTIMLVMTMGKGSIWRIGRRFVDIDELFRGFMRYRLHHGLHPQGRQFLVHSVRCMARSLPQWKRATTDRRDEPERLAA
jgi:hypothetical protein